LFGPKINLDFANMYFDQPDVAGHAFGPDSPEYEKKMYEMDAAFGYLIYKLRANGLLDKMNVIVVSDHGMTSLTEEEYVFLKDYPGVLDMINMNTSTFGEVSNINPKKSDQVRAPIFVAIQ
jgi:predicted AlkP superfamily pyrophosphatase or phosphodiesterase